MGNKPQITFYENIFLLPYRPFGTAEDNTVPRPLSKVLKMSSNRYLKGDFYIVYEKYRL